MNHQFTPELSIIIPLYNEEKVFRKLTERIDNMLKDKDIIVVTQSIFLNEILLRYLLYINIPVTDAIP